MHWSPFFPHFIRTLSSEWGGPFSLPKGTSYVHTFIYSEGEKCRRLSHLSSSDCHVRKPKEKPRHCFTPSLISRWFSLSKQEKRNADKWPSLALSCLSSLSVTVQDYCPLPRASKQASKRATNLKPPTQNQHNGRKVPSCLFPFAVSQTGFARRAFHPRHCNCSL